jgi:iron uptake system component EfeO
MDAAIDAREDDFKQKAADPKFTGFHRLEKALFGDHTTKGRPSLPTSWWPTLPS